VDLLTHLTLSPFSPPFSPPSSPCLPSAGQARWFLRLGRITSCHFNSDLFFYSIISTIWDLLFQFSSLKDFKSSFLDYEFTSFKSFSTHSSWFGGGNC